MKQVKAEGCFFVETVMQLIFKKKNVYGHLPVKTPFRYFAKTRVKH